MLRKSKKLKLEITDFERRLIVFSMVELRNRLISESRSTEDVDDILLKIC